MNKTELHLLYKSDTSFKYEPIECTVYLAKKTFDVVIDRDTLDPRILAQIDGNDTEREMEIQFVDPIYHEWIENKLCELLVN